VDSLFPLFEKLEVDLLNCLEKVLRVVKFLPSKSAPERSEGLGTNTAREASASEENWTSRKWECRTELTFSEQQATGLERFELLGKLEGVDVFDMKPMEMTRIGTVQDPIPIYSLVSSR